ncbi:proton-associated sugar transporter A isoform X1 [Vespula squamosa]|uniref:Proton-associated sugar transporter A isoform X1 n=1 Tax=Vespula squamosa TaxID=30214 RepID=A0ABD2B9I2_VESSQ
MVDKLHEYEGFTGRVHDVRDKVKEKWDLFKEWKNSVPLDQGLPGVLNHLRGPPKLERTLDDYAHIYRKKTRRELVRVSAAVMGIEFSYAAETAFVSPTLLKIGVDHQHMTLVWALSPLVGFFVTPILGSVSDRCRLKYGRRRPFILLLAIGVLIGLILVPNGEDMGYAFGDVSSWSNHTIPIGHRTTAKSSKDDDASTLKPSSHSWGIFFTILGTVLLDFDADACQSPARAYLLDVTIPEDHARGLSTFTIMAGLGGFMGYGLGGINWDATTIGVMLGGHLHATFTLITIIFIICVAFTITSFKEIPLEVLERDQYQQIQEEKIEESKGNEYDKITGEECTSYGAVDNEQDTNMAKNDEFMLKPLPVQESTKRPGEVPMIPDIPIQDANQTKYEMTDVEHDPKVTLREYLLSIVYMPHSLRMAPDGTKERELYESGVRFGCWGMSMYSLSCSCYSLIIEKLIKRYNTGMMLMAIVKHPAGVIIFSWTAGVMYSTLFTMPYLLVAHYHASSTFEITVEGEAIQSGGVRGLGTDVAIISSMVFLAQFFLSCCLGTIVSMSGTTTAVVCVASTLAACGAISATQIMYLDL